MNKQGLTPLDIRKQIFYMIQLVFSGLHRDEKGNIIANEKTSRFLEDDVYRVIYQLSCEFPAFFPGYLTKIVGDVPYNGCLEDILFSCGAFNVLGYGNQEQKKLLTVEPNTKQAMVMTLRQYYGEGELEKLLPVVSRFEELIGNRAAK